jgi:hypothetical protein
MRPDSIFTLAVAIGIALFPKVGYHLAVLLIIVILLFLLDPEDLVERWVSMRLRVKALFKCRSLRARVIAFRETDDDDGGWGRA